MLDRHGEYVYVCVRMGRNDTSSSSSSCSSSGAVVLPVELASELIESLRCKGIYYNMAIIIILIVAVVVARKQLLHGRNKMNAREGN